MRPEIASLIRGLSGMASSAEFMKNTVHTAVFGAERRGTTSEMSIDQTRIVCGEYKCGQKGRRCGR